MSWPSLQLPSAWYWVADVPRERNYKWLLDHPRELIKQFDDLTDAELQRLIEARDKMKIADAIKAIKKKEKDDGTS